MIEIGGPGPWGSSTWSESTSHHLASTDEFTVEKAFTSCPLLGIPKSWRSMTRVTNNNNIKSGDNSASDASSMLPSLHRHPARMSPLTWHCLRGEPRCYWLPCSYPAAEGRARGSFSSHDSWSSIQIRSYQLQYYHPLLTSSYVRKDETVSYLQTIPLIQLFSTVFFFEESFFYKTTLFIRFGKHKCNAIHYKSNHTKSFGHL